MSGHRITGSTGRAVHFTFDGRSYQGIEGDTLASALLANGVRVMGRSFKYHRPRGVWGAWVDDPNAIMSITKNGVELPNCQATTTYLEDGMQARAVNAFPSAAFDLKGGLDVLHRWLGAGFYYKTFMWPDWHLFEPAIRRMAGLGAVSEDVTKDFRSTQTHATCEVLVIGGGVAGLTAARAAAEAGRDVCLVDDHDRLGGTCLNRGPIDGRDSTEWIDMQRVAITRAGGRVMQRTTAFGIYDHKMVGLAQSGPFGTAPTLIRMRAKQIILATGALDRPITFANNDRPGIMSVEAACAFLARHNVMVGRNIALASNNSHADAAERALNDAGARVTRLDPARGTLRAVGRKHLSGVMQNDTRIDADTLLVSGGLTPLVHLWRHAGGKLDWCDARQAFLPGEPPNDMVAIGAANGTFDLDATLEEAQAIATGTAAKRSATGYDLAPLWPEPGAKGRQWIDFQHDVTLKDIELAARENYVPVEHLKRYTTLGMASDQGKTSNMAGLAAMAAIQDRPIPEVGTTTFRPPFVPVPIELYHGHHREQLWHPVKRLPLETTHRAAGAVLSEYGGWLRPAWYGAGDGPAAIDREVVMARETAGIFDASPLGKIEVIGPDAEAFVNFIYYNTIRTLKPGYLRYGFMLTEGGIVFDDGVIARLGPHRFVVSCSSSHVDSVRMHLEAWRQDGNDPDRIFVHDTTAQWATITVTGPQARAIVAALKLDLDVSNAAFPHMTLRETTWRGTALRIARVSFSGDVSFEMSIRASLAEEFWTALIDAGAKQNAGPIGLEALSVLRAEKGYILIGKDTDGETMPHDLGFSAPRERKSSAFVGDRSLHSDKANTAGRKQLVGLKVVSGADPLTTGAHVVREGASQGYVTSSYHSPALGHPIALALLENGAARMGETVDVQHLDETRDASVCSPCFLDPEGKRLNA